MSDYSNVVFTVLTVHADAARALFAYSIEGEREEGITTIFNFEGVKFADLMCEPKLTKDGIAWTKVWDDGGDAWAATSHVRFTEEGLLQELSLDDGGENPPIDELLTLCDQPEKLVRFIRAHARKTRPMPWDAQAEYGKLYASKNTQTRRAAP